MIRTIIHYIPVRPRRRRGSTSAPLICIEPNPGPNNKAKRKSAKTTTKKPPQPLTTTEIQIIKDKLTSGWTIKAIASLLHRHPHTIEQRAAEFKATADISNKPRTGRPRALSQRQCSVIVRSVRKNRRLTATDMSLEQFGHKRKRWTISKELHKAGLNARRPRKKPLISRKNVAERLCWAQIYQGLPAEDWNNIIWSDEAPFNLLSRAPSHYVRRGPTEELKPECIEPTLKHGGGGIMVWGCFSANYKGPLVRIQGRFTGERYRKEILDAKAIPFIFDIGRDLVTQSEGKYEPKVFFQDDNDPKHRHKKHCKPRFLELPEEAELEGFYFEHLTWPAQSPDLNPIENVWNWLKDRLYERVDKPKNLDQLWEQIQQEWEKMPMSVLQKFVNNMPQRIYELHCAHGLHIPH
jgi:transposase